MTGPVRTAPRTRTAGEQPPRPPNAWILYRSDRVREMPPPLPGQLRTQADVSRTISEQWRNESDATRAEYERRAEMKKAEHHAQYPDYRFQPKSKEQKERQRLEKKQEKERQPKRSRARVAAPPVAQAIPTSSSQASPNPVNNPSYSPYYAEARFGLSGPSPPLSAAPSPSEDYACLELPTDEVQAPSNNVSVIPDRSYALSPLTVPPLSCHTEHTTHSSVPPFSKTPPYPDTNQWPQSVDSSSPPSSSSSNTMTPSPLVPDPYSMPQTPVTNISPSDFLSFDLQPIAIENVRSWLGEPGAFDEAMQALLSVTGDPSIFQLANFDASALTSNPMGEIEVSMGQPTHHSFDSAFFTEFDLGGPLSFTMASQATAVNSQPPTDEASGFTSLLSNNSICSGLEHEAYSADDFINFDYSSNSTVSPADIPSASHSLEQSLETPQFAPYTPPSGAAHSSARRVAGSWKSSFVIPDSRIDISPPRSWGVPAM